MIPRLPGPARDQPPPLVLVADEDPRVAETIAFALHASHFRAVRVHDGEEALRRAHAERPDLVLASVLLPRRGGLEVCDVLRRDPELADVPVLILSSATDTEARIEALAHGADEFVVKPFAPKELVARVQRLLARARETTRQRRRSAELERDLGRMEGEARRAREDAVRERTLRSLAGGIVGELLRTLDLEELDSRLLQEARRQTGARSVALLAREGGLAFTPVAVRGELFERWAGLSLPERGTCVEWLVAAARPVLREELDRLPGSKRELAPLAAHGVALLVALRAGAEVEALLVCEDRADGSAFAPPDRERLAALCAAVAPARVAACRFRDQQDRTLALLAATTSPEPRRRDAARESLERLAAAADSLGMPRAERASLIQALELGPWAWSEAGRAALEALAGETPTRRMRRLKDTLALAERLANGEPAAADDSLPLLVAMGLRYQSLRHTGRSPFEAWRTALAWLGLPGDPMLRAAFPEVIEPAR